MRIDAHQHFWRRDRGDYGWLTPALTPLWRDYLPDDLAPLLDEHAITGTVLVQAAATAAETAFMLPLAAAHDFIRGVVGWTDLAAPDAPDRIAALAAEPKLVGLRPMLQDLPDDRYILDPAVQPALAAMARHGLALDALIRPRQLPQMLALHAAHPDLRIVIDHAAKPDLASGDLARWRKDIAHVAATGQLFCKLSGLATEAGPGWTPAQLQPAAEFVLGVFGTDRVMWGSDWPVLNLAGDYAGWVAATQELLASLGDEGKAAVLGETARQFYRLQDI
ncbi:MAG: amidohydrolase [Alphaproteobacteria bacterium]|nr:MAG: amidohydrolase [Alphaproteobacteria bacterium]